MKTSVLALVLLVSSNSIHALEKNENPFMFKVKQAIKKAIKVDPDSLVNKRKPASVSERFSENQIDFRSKSKEDLKNLCALSCGDEYSHKVEIRDFFQLKQYPEKLSRAGLTCFKKTQWAQSGTPCHQRESFLGIHTRGLAPTKTEVHRGSWSTKRGGAWCIAYNEDDFPGMASDIASEKYRPGQVACVSGIKLGSF